jgi:hypothetical protein
MILFYQLGMFFYNNLNAIFLVYTVSLGDSGSV